MNDLAGAAAPRRRCYDPIPAPLPCLLAPLLLAGLAVSVFILAVVHNSLLFASLLLLSALLVGFLVWNAASLRANRAAVVFLDRLPASDLLAASDGQLVKITGLVSCGDAYLESSYEKVVRCMYTSTLLYEVRGFIPNWGCFRWNLAYLERLCVDFYITDMKSGTRALVKAGYSSKIVPLIEESMLVKATSKSRDLSSTLKKWLEERCISAEVRPLCLKEGYIKEGNSVTVMGTLSRKSGVLMIVPPPGPISTGCLLQKFLLPVDIDGIVLRVTDRTSFDANPSLP